MAETDVEMAQRHVEDGTALIERQRALIDFLRLNGHHETARRAEALLQELLAIQAEYLIHARRLADKRDHHG